VPAALCALLSALERRFGPKLDLLEQEVDWQEAGITPQWLRAWWEKHKAEDAERLAREDRQEERAAARRAAMAKLSPDERAALGI